MYKYEITYKDGTKETISDVSEFIARDGMVIFSLSDTREIFINFELINRINGEYEYEN